MPRPNSIFDAGAYILPDFITPAEEDRILLRIAQAPWITDLRRRVQHYGYRYDYAGNSAPAPAPAFPRWTAVFAQRLSPHFAGDLPDQCIVNEYRPGHTIGMHADHRDFGPIVASLTLAAAWPMRFRLRSAKPYDRGALPRDEIAILPRRSVLVLTGDARHHWMHGITSPDSAPQAVTRVSATFRGVYGHSGAPE